MSETQPKDQHMKCNVILTTLLLAAAPVWAQTVASTSYTNSAVTGIPDGNPVGVTELFTVSGLSGSITNVQVTLDITGGFNGDLYAYLVGPQGQFAVLLNRVGLTGSNPVGYSDAGMNITLDGLAANNIHAYGSVGGYSLNGTTWAADGRNIDPQSVGSVFGAASTAANLSLFQNTDANGVWTFFIADLAAGGGMANLNSAILTIMTVPEPQTWVMLGGGMAVFFVFRRRKAS
jgi:subtilisin-like proprotein convertase family protein